jgi:hypothetical protein
MTVTLEIANNVSTTETRGGIKFELVLEQASSEMPVKVLQSPARNISAAEIESKLKAAEERRQSLQNQKLEELKEKTDGRIVELRGKRNEFENVFKEEARQSLDKKMETSKENRENIIKSIQEKQREHVILIENKRKQSEEAAARQIPELLSKINKKFEIAAESREAQNAALQERLREHERRISEVRQNKENQTNSEEAKATEQVE